MLNLFSEPFEFIYNWNLKEAKKFINPDSHFFNAVYYYYKGNYKKSFDEVNKVKDENETILYWKSRIEKVYNLSKDFTEFKTKHFIVRLKEPDLKLKKYLKTYLDRIYKNIGKIFDFYPKEKIIIEIYPVKKSFSIASTLTFEQLKNSGTIGICKFNRIMMLSPRLLAYGYNWVDTISHEYTHFIIGKITHLNIPLWLNEGIAKWSEKRWKIYDIDPYGYYYKNYLKKIKDGQWIKFERFKTGLPSLKNQEEISLAFSEVLFITDYLIKNYGRKKFVKFLKKLGKGESFNFIFKKLFKIKIEDFINLCKKEINKMNINFIRGVESPFPVFKGEEIFSSNDYIRLGDRFRIKGYYKLALKEYFKGIENEPGNGVILTKIGKTYLKMKEKNKAMKFLKEAKKYSPSYLPLRTTLLRLYLKENNIEKAKQELENIILINPFYPDIEKWEKLLNEKRK